MILIEQISEFPPFWILLSTLFFDFLAVGELQVSRKILFSENRGGKQLTPEARIGETKVVKLLSTQFCLTILNSMVLEKKPFGMLTNPLVKVG